MMKLTGNFSLINVHSLLIFCYLILLTNNIFKGSSTSYIGSDQNGISSDSYDSW